MVLVALLGAALVLGACSGGSQPSSVTWRNVTVPVPDGWYVIEQADTRLSLASHDLRPDQAAGSPADRPEGDVLGMFFTFEPRTIPDDWRRFVAEQGATLESDQALVLEGDVPATQLVYSYVTDGLPTREMVVVIPSRAIVLIAQPIPAPGDEDGPEVFLRHIETFLEVLEGARFGPPLME